MTHRARALAIAILAGALGLAACARKGDPVQASLDAIVNAANARDASALFEKVAANFQGADGSGRADAAAAVARYFAAYEDLSVSISDVRIEHGDGAARVRLTAEMSGRPRKIGGLEGLVPSSSKYDFDLRLVSEDGAWKVAWAQWNPTGSGSRKD